jgi:regulator of RNase E activity RraA
MNQPVIGSETLDLLHQVSTATLTTQLFKRGLRNTFLHPLAPMNPEATSFAGPAFTLRYIPAREDLDVLAAFDDYDHPQRAAIEATQPGQVLVMDCRGVSRAASAGDILITRLFQRGAAAVISDGSFRDSPTLRHMPFPVFSAGASALTNLAYHHAVDTGVPVGCAGVAVFPGDIMVGDADGVVCIPGELADEVAHDAWEQSQLEDFILDKVRRGAPLRGTYPADAATRAEYEEHRAAAR